MVDLDSLVTDYILEIKQINIPEYPDAFNPSIVRWHGELLLAFRIRDPETKSTNQIGFVWLDSDFQPTGSPRLLEFRYKNPLLPAKEQDPRLLVAEDTLYIVFNNIVGPVSEELRRMFVGTVQHEDGCFFVDSLSCMLHFEGATKKMEKNWSPFIWENQLLLAYSIHPHRIFRPLDSAMCESFPVAHSNVNWNWGELRGGTPALMWDGQYLAFFHSYKNIATVQSGGKIMSHYFMGAYTFSKDPPFALKHISSQPIVGDKFYNGPMYKTWKPLRVIFPGGYIFDDQYIWVVYGRQDHELWVVKLDRTGLFQNMIPIQD